VIPYPEQKGNKKIVLCYSVVADENTHSYFLVSVFFIIFHNARRCSKSKWHKEIYLLIFLPFQPSITSDFEANVYGINK